MSAGPGGETLTERLVVTALDAYEPAAARRDGGRALFDYLACRAAGRRIAPPGLGDAGAAALLDRDDVHWPSLSHPGAIVWTVVLAAGAEGEVRWRAAQAGYEVTARVARALGPDHRVHWHATATAGAVGGAVAAALALGSDPVTAAGHAISVTGGSIVAVLERSGTRVVHRDVAATTALQCARLTGMPATRHGLEHPRGLFAAMGGAPDLLLEPAPPALGAVSFRRHATNGFCQALVEAACELAGAAPAAGPVIVEVPEAVLALASEPRPRDAEEAWWSAEHAVAVCLLGLDLGDEALVADPRVAALRERIELRPGPVSRVTAGRRTAQRAQAVDVTDDDLVAKWHALNPGVPQPLDLLEKGSA